MKQWDRQTEKAKQVSTSLRSALRRRGADTHTAEDIAQDTLIIALRNPPADRGRFRGWLRVVAIRLWQRARTRESERRTREWAAAVPQCTDGPHVEDREASLLRRYVEELPEPYRTALTLRFFEGLEVREIAERRSVSRATVQTHIRRGIERLRARLGTRSDRRWRWSSAFVWLRRLLPEGAPRSPGTALRLLVIAGFSAASLFFGWLLLDPLRGHAPRAAPVEIAESALSGGDLLASGTTPGPLPDHRKSLLVAAHSPGPILAGTVRTPLGQPLPDACVHVADASDGTERTTLSDELGRYEIAAAGQLVWATHDEWCESPRLYVASLVDRARADIVLARTRGSAQVEIVDAAGHPVVGARVYVDDSRCSLQSTTPAGTLEASTVRPPAITDEEGHCRILFQEQDETELCVVGAELPAWHGYVLTPEKSGFLRIELPRPSSLTGTCRDETGQPLSDACVELIQFAGRVHRQTRTDSGGNYWIPGLAPGEVIVRACERGLGRASAYAASRLDPEQEGRLDLVLGDDASILGRVVSDEGSVAGARVECEVGNMHPALEPRRIVVTDANGRFVIRGCPPTAAHDLQIFVPGARDPGLRLSELLPGCVEGVYALPSADLARAPLELQVSGAVTPSLIELRRVSHALSTVLDSDVTTPGRFRSEPLPAGEYQVVAWHRELGAWQMAYLAHDPYRLVVHERSLREPRSLIVGVELPEGAHPSEVEVSTLALRFHRHGLGGDGAGSGRRLLSWNEEVSGFVGTVLPGLHTLLVRGSGLTEEHRAVEVRPGQDLRISVALARGVEAIVRFESPIMPEGRLSRGLRQLEDVSLDVFTPGATVNLVLRWKDHRRVNGGFEFTVALPAGTFELHARTMCNSSRPCAPREGRCKLEPTALDSTQGRPRITIPLVNAPG